LHTFLGFFFFFLKKKNKIKVYGYLVPFCAM
jgi:hypothetical protein